jgi:hypothetical protein
MLERPQTKNKTRRPFELFNEIFAVSKKSVARDSSKFRSGHSACIFWHLRLQHSRHSPHSFWMATRSRVTQRTARCHEARKHPPEFPPAAFVKGEDACRALSPQRDEDMIFIKSPMTPKKRPGVSEFPANYRLGFFEVSPARPGVFVETPTL